MPILAGRYELERRLGGGGMAEVFLARLVGKEGFSRHVAIKRVLAHLATDESFARMFVAEAQMCAKLQHPNIVSVLDFDRDEEGRPFLVIELVDGPSLAELADGGALPVGTAVHLASELLRGLAYAHDVPSGEGTRGVVHRDISPHNVLLSWEGAVKVSDFGIAKARAASGVTASELLKGKPAYMSPEQANGEALDGRSDLFSSGIVLWELLVGRALFSGHTTQETLARVLFAPIPSPRSIRSEIPDDVDTVVMNLLARERGDRYADANDAITALLACKDYPRDGREKLVALLADRFAKDAPQRSRMLAEVPTVRTPLESAPTLPSPRDARRTRPVYFALGGIAIAGIAVAITLIVTRSTTRKVATVDDSSSVVAEGAAVDEAVGAPVAPIVVDARPEAADAKRDVAADPTRARPTLGTASVPPSDAMRPKIVDAGVGKMPSEADLQAERARILLASKGPSSIPFSPPDETSVDATQYFQDAQAEVRRIFGREGRVVGLAYSGIGRSGRLDGTRPGHALRITFVIDPPTDDGFYCVNFSSNYANIDGRFRLGLGKSEKYCESLDHGAVYPRCTAIELYQRALHLGHREQRGPVVALLRHGTWELLASADGARIGKTANDCH